MFASRLTLSTRNGLMSGSWPPPSSPPPGAPPNSPRNRAECSSLTWERHKERVVTAAHTTPCCARVGNRNIVQLGGLERHKEQEAMTAMHALFKTYFAQRFVRSKQGDVYARLCGAAGPLAGACPSLLVAQLRGHGCRDRNTPARPELAVSSFSFSSCNRNHPNHPNDQPLQTPPASFGSPFAGCAPCWQGRT